VLPRARGLEKKTEKKRFALDSDFLNSVVHTYTFSTGELQRDGMSPIFYDGLSLWEVFTGQGADAVSVLRVGSGISTVVAASSANTVTVGTPTAGGGHTLFAIRRQRCSIHPT
jgi:hypothetical protein